MLSAPSPLPRGNAPTSIRLLPEPALPTPIATPFKLARRPASSPTGPTLNPGSALPSLRERQNPSAEWTGFVVRGGFGISRFTQDYASGAMNLYNPPFISQN